VSTRAQNHRREFQLYMARVFAPYANFRRNRETGSYLSHSVQVAWGIWQAASYSPYRPLVDGFGERIDAPRRSERRQSKSKGASRRAVGKRGRPVMTRTARRRKWQRR
jgi:hypothetical protein